MQSLFPSFRLWLAVLVGLLTAAPVARAQAPTVTPASLAPAANARTAARNTTVVVPFSQAIDPATAGSIKIHSTQYRGLRTAAASTGGSTVTLTPTVPATGSQVAAFKPGETVMVTVPATVLGTGGGAATPYVYQFTAAATGGYGSFGGGSDPAVGSNPYSVAVGDVDGDGDLDMLCTSQGSSTVSVRLNNGNGSFSGGSDPGVGSYPRSVALGDVDGDGDLDFLTANSGSNTVSVRLNNGTGTFSGGSNPAVGNNIYSVAVGDVDGDGDLDMLTANNNSGTVSVRLNNGSGTFSGGSDPAVGSNPVSVAVGDVDGDGDLDLLTANYNFSGTVSVRLNNGTGTFSGGSDPAVSSYPFSVVVGDVDGDGDLDMLTNTVSVRLNNGTGTFSGGSDPAVGSYPLSVAMGDVDGDGDLDLLTANYTTSGTVSVRLNTPPPTISSFTPPAGVVGTSVVITGTNFTGVTGVKFNTTAATTYTVNSATQITATVPAGATTGLISITNALGTGASSTPFTVLLTLTGSQVNSCIGANNGTASVVASDGSAPYSYNWSPAPGGGQGSATATGLAVATYTVTVTDNVGTQATRSFTISNSDSTPPVAVAQNVTLTLDATGAATLTGAALNNGSTDNCGIASLTPSRTSFSCADKSSPANLNALKFDGDNDYVSLPTGVVNTATTDGTGFTFEAWVHFAATPSVWARIFDFGRGTDNYLFLAANNVIDSRLRLGIKNGGTEYVITTTAPATALLGWHHYAVTMSKAAGIVTGQVFLDGTQVGNNNSLGNLLLGNLGTLNLLYLGKAQFNDPYPNATYDEVRIWDVARTGAELKAAKGQTLTGNEAGLRAYYPFEHTSGTALADASGRGNTGTLNSFALSGTASNWVSSTAPVVASATSVTLTVRDAAGNQSTATARVTVLQPSVASTPALTWTGTAGTTWSDCGNWSYGLVPVASQTVTIPAGLTNYPTLSSGTATLAGLTVASGASFTLASGAILQITGNVDNQGPTLAGTVLLNGPAAQTVAGSFSTLTVNKASGITTTLSADASVNTMLTMTSGILNTGSNALTLGPTATFVESTTSYVTGTVQTTRSLSTAVANTFGGLGLTLTPAASSSTLPGSTFVRRVTGTARTGVSGRTGILRSFDIQPTVNTGLNVTLVFSYRDVELSGIPKASLALFKSENGTADTWGRQRNVTLNAAANTATLAGVSSFSIWTLGNASAPLPVELAAFTAQAEGPAARLKWTTASEKNNAYFDVERSLDGHEFSKIGQEQGQGSKASPSSYTFLDKQLPAGTSYYRLRQVDTDGTASYSPVRTVTMTAPLAASFTVYPTEARPGQPLHYAYTGPALAADAVLEVYDATGRCVQRQAADPAGVLNNKALSSGWYWVRLQSAGDSQQARFYQP